MAVDSSEVVGTAVLEKPKGKGKEKSTALAKVQTKSGVSDLTLTPEKFIESAIKSGLFKDTKNVAEAYIKITLGASLGIDPATAMASIILVNGRPTFTANLIAARIMQSGRYRYEIKEKSATRCSIQFFQKIEDWTKDGKQFFRWIEPGPPEVFTFEMAKRAGLTRNATWTSWPEAMCFCRCLTAGARAYTPDLWVGNAIYTPDELDPQMKLVVSPEGEVIPDAEYTVTPARGGDLVQEIESLLAETGADRVKFLKHFGVASPEKLTPDDQVKAVGLLKTKRDSAPKGGG